MTIGSSLFLIALGAILHFAVEDKVSDVDLSTVGTILMIVGAAGLILGLFLMQRARSVIVERDVHDVPPRSRL